MMRKRLFGIFVLVIPALILGSFFGMQAMRNAESDKLAGQISQMVEQYERGVTSCVDFSELNSFAWDRLFIFGPYSSPEQIAEVLNLSHPIFLGTTIESNDNVVLLVFMKNQRLIKYIEIPRGPGDFASVHSPDGYVVGEACFVKDEYGNMRWINQD